MKNKTIYIDIDETICFYDKKREYHLAKPYNERIETINDLFLKGNTIVYYTARGSKTGLDWYDLTEKQLEKWGAKYTKLITGKKPVYDLFICDKAINSNMFFKS